MAFSAKVYALDAAAKRRLKLGGVKVPLASQSARNPTPKELKEVLSGLVEYRIGTLFDPSPGSQWQVEVWHLEKPAVNPWVFITIDDFRGEDIPQALSFPRGTPELMVRIVDELSKRVGPLVLHPDTVPPAIIQPNSDNRDLLHCWRKNEPQPVKQLGLPTSLRPRTVDLNLAMVEAVLNPLPGYVSKHQFADWRVEDSLRRASWFSNCGNPCFIDLSVAIQQFDNWGRALESCSSHEWSNIQVAAQNQLTLFLHRNDNENYQNWNRFVQDRKQAILDPLVEKQVRPFQEKHGFPVRWVQCVQWDILGALMEEMYARSQHGAHFFHELLMVYEAGHFPCGWIGEWPIGKLLIF